MTPSEMNGVLHPKKAALTTKMADETVSFIPRWPIWQEFGIEFPDITLEIGILHKKTHHFARLALLTYNFPLKFLMEFLKEHVTAYLPGAGLTVIKQAVGPGRGFSIALRMS